MILTLLSSGQQIEWDPVTHAGRPVQLTGRARFILAQEKSNAAQGLVRLSAAPAASQAIPAPRRNDNPEPVQAPMTLSPDEMAQAVFAEMEDDILGPGVRAKLRQMVTRKATEAWNANQKLQPGPKSPAEFDRFRQSIEDGTVAAVRAYARMKLVNPVELQVDIAGSKVNPPQT